MMCQTTNKNELLEFDSIVNHQVKKKETLYSISKLYDVNIDDIIRLNSGIEKNRLKRKSFLIIPLKKKNKINFTKNESINNDRLDSVIFSSKFKKLLIENNFKRKRLNIALFAPFKLNTINLDSVNQTQKNLSEINLTTISLNFYNGLKTAVKELEDKGVQINVNVFDTENSLEKIKQLKTLNLSSFDIIIGPFISRNFNELSQNIDSLIVSPFVTDNINLSKNVVITTPTDEIKSKFIYEIIDKNIEKTEDQCVIVIADSNNITKTSTLIEKFPNAELLKIDENSLFIDPDVTDSIMDTNKENWVFLETSKPNLISSITSLLSSQNNKKRKIKLFSTISGENYENPNINLDNLGNISFLYPSNSKPNYSDSFKFFSRIFMNEYGNLPERISVRARDLVFDLLLRTLVYGSFHNSLDHGETEYFQNKFDYILTTNSIMNKSFFILQHSDLEVLEFNKQSKEN